MDLLQNPSPYDALLGPATFILAMHSISGSFIHTMDPINGVPGIIAMNIIQCYPIIELLLLLVCEVPQTIPVRTAPRIEGPDIVRSRSEVLC